MVKYQQSSLNFTAVTLSCGLVALMAMGDVSGMRIALKWHDKWKIVRHLLR
ncbi:hypothetical protein [Bartonella pachyuromydis]|uniref:Uncharacterized protein n=1 Tax=Bartonella pachyuromydis TaxID=931097 RepID=A0ABP8VIP4_9HYPH